MKDEATDEEMIIYYRGMLSEYKRNHPELTKEECKALQEWTNKGHNIHTNPYHEYERCGTYKDDFIIGYRAYHEQPKK